MLSSQKGNILLEVIPVIILLVILLRYTFGFFGVVHTGILNSIASRNYLFETLRHRADPNYFRPQLANGRTLKMDQLFGNRYSTQISEVREKHVGAPNQWATARNVSYPPTPDGDIIGNPDYHNNRVINDVHPGQRYGKDDGDGSDPVWIRTRYGLCLDVACGI